MKVILLQDVAKVGKKFDVKEISDGFALNFLIPQKKAKPATANAIKELESAKKKNDEIEQIKEAGLIESIKALKDDTITVYAKISEEGSLFAKIGKKEIINSIKDQKALEIEEDNIVLEKPIKEGGEHTIEIKANGDKATFKLNIVEGEA